MMTHPSPIAIKGAMHGPTKRRLSDSSYSDHSRSISCSIYMKKLLVSQAYRVAVT